MKDTVISFFNQPKKVIISSLIIAIIIGLFAYFNINKPVTGQFTGSGSNTVAGQIDNASTTKNISLGFLSAGQIKDVFVKVGDKVNEGEVLATLDAGNAAGILAQANAAYETAQANYDKIINGATGATVDVAKAAVNTAKVNLDEIIKQQGILTSNAYRTLLSNGLTAVAEKADNDKSNTAIDNSQAPQVSGTYTCSKEGSYEISPYASGVNSGYSFTFRGLEEGLGTVTNFTPQSLGQCGLFVQFPAGYSSINLNWKIEVPNKNGLNYNSNYNAYELALQNKDQAIAVAQATLDQVNTSLTALVSAARPEDIAVAKAQVDNASGALQIANAAYKNTIISAPGDGVITAVDIMPGQIAISNSPAIEFTGVINQ